MKSNETSKDCRVLMLIENLSFPWDRRMRHEAEALREAGYQVGVICPKGEGHDEQWFEEINGIKIYRYPMLVQASGGLAYLAEYSWGFLCTTFLLMLVWMKDGFDIIHSANPPDMFFLLARPFKVLGKKFVYDQHDVCPELYESKFNRKDWKHRALLYLEQGSYRAADLVISTNQSYREIAMTRGGVPEERTVIVRNGVDTNWFCPRKVRPELKEKFAYMALYLGVMGKQDGVDRVVQAAHHLVHTYGRKDVVFVMVGKGECWQELQDLSRELKVDEYMRFLGYVPDDLLLDYLSAADVCLAPDPPDRMNNLSTMTKIMEYMACGQPIVSFDLLETRRSAGEAAVYVAEDNSLFAGAMNGLLNDPVQREHMRNVGLDRSHRLVGLEYSRRALVAAYDRLSGNYAPLPVAPLQEVRTQEVRTEEVAEPLGVDG